MSFLSRMFGSSPLKLTQQLGAYPLERGDISPLYVFFGVENRSRETVTISSVRIVPKVADEPLGVKLEGEVPVDVTVGSDVRYEVRARDLATTSKAAGYTGKPKLSFVVTDGEGREHRHDFTLRVDEYLALKDE